MRARSRLRFVLLLVPAFAAGCMTWGSHRLPEPSSGQRLPDPVRITRTDAATLLLHDPMVVGDSIVGYTGERERAAVALSQVRRAEGRKVNFAGTAGVSFAVTLVVVAVVTVVALAAVWGGSDY